MADDQALFPLSSRSRRACGYPLRRKHGMRPFDRIVTASEDGARSCNASRWNCVLFSRWMRGVSVSTVVRGISEGGACDDSSNEYVRRRPPPKCHRSVRRRERDCSGCESMRRRTGTATEDSSIPTVSTGCRLSSSSSCDCSFRNCWLHTSSSFSLPVITWKWRGRSTSTSSQNATVTWIVTEPLNQPQ